jgi:hypothetical protein
MERHSVPNSRNSRGHCDSPQLLRLLSNKEVKDEHVNAMNLDPRDKEYEINRHRHSDEAYRREMASKHRGW